MSPELQRSLAEHRLLVDHNIDPEAIRNLIADEATWGDAMADSIIDYLIAATE